MFLLGKGLVIGISTNFKRWNLGGFSGGGGSLLGGGAIFHGGGVRTLEDTMINKKLFT